MSERTCGWCGAPIDHMMVKAIYCCLQHKKNAASARHRERNPGYYKRYTGSPARVAWTEANREQIRVYARDQQARYRAEHPDAASRWWAENPERHRLYQAQRRARLASEAREATPKDIRRLVERHRGCCAYCGVRTDSLHLDHVVPIIRGGRHSIGNLVPACQPCNSSKGAQLLYKWRVRVLLTQYAQSLEA